MSNLPVPKFGQFDVYMHNKKRKLQHINDLTSVESTLFHHICFHINGDTNPPLDTLRQLILRYGGTYEQYDMKRVDIIIAETLSKAKQHTWRLYTVLKPAFVMDSIRHGQLMEQYKYKLQSNAHFIESFFEQSRLHYLSAWKAELVKLSLIHI